MNQSIEAVKARDRADPFTMPYFNDLETYRSARWTAPPWWPHGSYEELDEIVRRAAEMHVPTPDELDRMAVQWAMADTPVYVADAARMAGTPVYVADTAAAATSAT